MHAQTGTVAGATASMRMADLVQTFDWASTRLGPRESWPQSLRTIVDMMLATGNAMCLMWGPERTFLYNDRYAQILGTRHPHAFGLPIRDAWPDVWTDIEPLVERTFAGETLTFEDMPLAMTRNGYHEDTWWTFSYSPVRDETGAVAGLLNVTTETTTQVLAERSRDTALADLRASQNKLAALIEASSDSLYSMSPDWQEMRTLQGRGFIADKTSPSVRWMDQYLFPEDQPAIVRMIDASVATGAPFEMEHRVRRADGSAGWVFSRSVPIRDEQDRVTEWFGMASDVTERHRNAESLRESEAFLRGVLASSNDCIKVLDLDANLVFMSEGGQRVMEVSDFNAIQGCPWPDFWIGEGNLAAKEAIASARAGQPAAFQGYADTMRGTRLYWDVQVSPIFGADGRPERILSVSRDISALKASEEARVVLNQELSHRMKNLLAMVQAITAQTMRQAKTMEEANEAVFTRISALARAQDILTRTSFEQADVAEIVAAAIGPHQTRDPRIEWSGPRYGLTAQQALGLSLAIHELATNAAKYGALSNETGRVAMSWGEADGAFTFHWIETGGPPVIAPERRGFGSKLIERIVASYFDGEGHIDFDPSGIRFKLVAGAVERASQAA